MIRKTDDQKAGSAAVTVGEDAYKLLHLFCPFCGKPDRSGCEHRLFVTQLDAFERIKPDFESFMRVHYALDDDEEIDDIVIRVANPRRHDRRTVCFASDLGLAWLAKQGAPGS